MVSALIGCRSSTSMSSASARWISPAMRTTAPANVLAHSRIGPYTASNAKRYVHGVGDESKDMTEVGDSPETQAETQRYLGSRRDTKPATPRNLLKTNLSSDVPILAGAAK